MGRDTRFHKRTVLSRLFDIVRNFLALLGLMVILYYSRTNGMAFNMVWIYMVEYPCGAVADAVRTILNYTIYGT